jgi:hypothetical protein
MSKSLTYLGGTVGFLPAGFTGILPVIQPVFVPAHLFLKNPCPFVKSVSKVSVPQRELAVLPSFLCSFVVDWLTSTQLMGVRTIASFCATSQPSTPNPLNCHPLRNLAQSYANLRLIKRNPQTRNPKSRTQLCEAN